MADIHIACPLCQWEPDGNSYWACSRCGHTWDTFETAARCPSCGYRHEYTQCILFAGGCHKISLHEDWYHGLDEFVEEQCKGILVTTKEPSIQKP